MTGFAGLYALGVFLAVCFSLSLFFRRRNRKIDAFDPSDGDPTAPALQRAYVTPWTWEECLEFLRRRNAYDTMDYALAEEDGSSCAIAFNSDKTAWANQRLDMIRRQANYLLRLEPSACGAAFTLEYVDAPLRQPLSNVDMDEFFLRKLDAKPLHEQS